MEAEKIFIIHGVPQSSDALRVKIKDTFEWNSTLPELYEKVPLEL